MISFFFLLFFSRLSAQATTHAATNFDHLNRTDGHSLYVQPHRILFSTHSASPWSRSRRPWILRREATYPVTITASNPSFKNRAGDGDGVIIHGDDNSETEVSPCSENLTFFSSVKYLFHECEGNNNQVAQTIATAAWLMVLFYLLGSTASDYFSCTLEKLSDTLQLSPAVAGVTLLAIGNGAPDVFSSMAAFVSSDKSGSIGFSCVLGGALFITTVVSGTVVLVTCRGKEASPERINLVCFVRDAVFLLVSAGILAAILLDGKVYFWEALSFLGVYAIYAVSVWAAEVLENRSSKETSINDPLLLKVDRIEGPQLLKAITESHLPEWINPSLSTQQHQHHIHSQDLELENLLERKKGSTILANFEHLLLLFYKYGIEWPLALPRRLTIPIIEEAQWSRPLAVISCTLAPFFVGVVWILHCDVSVDLVYVVLGLSTCVGGLLGILAFMNTENAKPPQQFLWLWLGGGFFMSIVWFYLVADQVVQSLETLGVLFSINPAILGLTVLAWGNSIGDLVADLALACGGRDGVQIAITGCYAGPLFNMVVGLGLSLVIACWRSDPDPLLVTDEDGSLFFIIGFLAVGLAWSLVMLPLNKMILSKSFGAGLLLLYCSFLVTGMCYAIGWISS